MRPPSPNAGLRVLLVEDNPDIRDGLAQLLETEGYAVEAVGSAEEGLAALRREGHFDLVVSDYMLPGETGAWMLDEASRAGLLQTTQALMVTAHPRVRGPHGIQVIQKPLDIDDFLKVVFDLLRPARDRRSGGRPLQEPLPADEGARCELRLYISMGSASSMRALRNLQQVLKDYDARQVRLTVYNLSHELAASAVEDRVVFTPTLVKCTPGPRAWVLGDLSRAQAVTDLLSLSGVDPVQ